MRFEEFDTPEAEKTEIKPQYASQQSKKLPDGEYVCEIKKGELKETDNGMVFTFTGLILEGPKKGWHIERVIFFFKKNLNTEQEKKEYLLKQHGEHKRDLATLGFDVENWTAANGRKFSDQLVIAQQVMVGMKVRFRKRTNDFGSNVYLDRRLTDDKPAKIGPEEMVEVVTAPTDGTDPLDVKSDHAPADDAPPPAATEEIIPF